jgi:hypothetical protein
MQNLNAMLTILDELIKVSPKLVGLRDWLRSDGEGGIEHLSAMMSYISWMYVNWPDFRENFDAIARRAEEKMQAEEVPVAADMRH